MYIYTYIHNAGNKQALLIIFCSELLPSSFLIIDPGLDATLLLEAFELVHVERQHGDVWWCVLALHNRERECRQQRHL